MSHENAFKSNSKLCKKNMFFSLVILFFMNDDRREIMKEKRQAYSKLNLDQILKLFRVKTSFKQNEKFLQMLIQTKQTKKLYSENDICFN